MAQRLNMDEYVSPNHWSVQRFEAFQGMDPKREFALVAPVLIYFAADLRWKERARTALQKMRTVKHPFFKSLEQPVNTILEMKATPEGLTSRYNALVMWMANEVCPGIESRIDGYGAFAFQVGKDPDVLSGCSAGYFGFFDNFEHLQERLLEAQGATESDEVFA